MKLDFFIPKPYETRFSMTVKVSTSGIFRCVLPEEIEKLFKRFGILEKSRGVGNFNNSTYEGLKKDVEKAIDALCSEELISNELVLRFGIETYCSYTIGKENDFMPNAT